MRLKLAILEHDQNYLNRIISVFNAKYSDKLEIYSFTDLEMAKVALTESKIDVLVMNNSFDIDISSLPQNCAFAYLVDSVDINHLNGQKAIGKYQKIDLIYKEILNIYSEKAGSVIDIKSEGGCAKTYLFCSPNGGVGTSSMAAASALHFAAKGEKTLYLNLEKLGSSDLFFTGEGQFDMSDIIFALKSKNVNLLMKLESCIKYDRRGVCFFSQPKIALDMVELSQDDIVKLLSELKRSRLYSRIIIDMDFTLDVGGLTISDQVDKIIWIGDGSEISNDKIQKAYTAISIMEQDRSLTITKKLHLIYNKFSNKTGKTVGEIGIKSIGGAPRYDHASTQQVVENLSRMEMLSKLMNQ